MKLVLDASVAVAALREGEPDHRAARARLERVLTAEDEIVVPAIFLPEVASALARRGWSLGDVDRALSAIVPTASHAIVTVGPRAAARVARLAVLAKLRAADAVYAWVAMSRGLPLCTLDRKLRERAALHCATIGP